MTDFTSNYPTRLPNTVHMRDGASKLTAQISKLDAAEDSTRDMINRISSLLHDILEPQSHHASRKQKVSEKRIELTSSIIILNSIREQFRYGYAVLYTLWNQWRDVQAEDESEEIAGQVKKLNRTHERNSQGIVALWREVRDLHREEIKLTGEKGLVGCKAGKGRTSGMAWGHVLRVFSGLESDT